MKVASGDKPAPTHVAPQLGAGDTNCFNFNVLKLS